MNVRQLKVTDCDPYRIKNEFSDVSRVQKFELAEEEYDKRTDSVRDYLRRNKLGKFSDQKPEEVPQYSTDGIEVGQRCEIETDNIKRRGAVRFVGETKFKEGLWIGVEYDEPLGKNDGRLKFLIPYETYTNNK
eukprot:Partr_v1_DN23558_c1_g1_i1_m14245 putative tubulin folding cofactor B